MKKSIWIILMIVCLPRGIQHSFGQNDSDDICFGKYRYVHSSIMNEDREIYVYLPDNYENSRDSYPVVFQLYSHFLHSYYLPAVRTTDIMGGSGLAPEMIVVGIKNREFRYRDLLPVDYYGATSEIDHFQDFFEKELIPFIEKNYRVNTYRILSAPQAGAAFAVYTMSTRPALFNAYFITSPFWIGSCREVLLNMFSEAVKHYDYSNTFLMMTYGKYEAGGELEAINTFKTYINQIKTPTFTFYENIIGPDFGFSTPIDIETGMKKLFRDYKFPGTEKGQPLEVIIKYYRSLSRKMGMDIIVPEHALVFEGDKFMQEKQFDKALEIFKRMNELYPDGLMGYDRLGGIYLSKDMPEKALEYYQRFLDRQPLNPRIKSIIEHIKQEMNHEN